MNDGADIPTFDLRAGESSSPATPPLLPGLPPGVYGPTVPGYEILEEIGRGGMGVVYRARQRDGGRLVALKVVIGGAFAGPTANARFRMEADALARLHHPNVVEVIDFGEHGGLAYIAFEYIDGPTLRRWQAGAPVVPRTAATLIVAIARAVQHAHEMNIIHRDLKPGNVLLAGVGNPAVCEGADAAATPKVGDFGLAKLIDGDGSITASGVACGTPNYMSPEQVRGGPAASRITVDVWGLGAVLFELLAGRPPYLGSDPAAIMQDIALNDPPDVRAVVRDVPPALAHIVAKCLEKNPDRRYPSAQALADDVGRFLSGAAVRARRIGIAVRAGRWVRRNPFASLVGVLLLAALATVSAVAVALQRSADRERAARAGEQAALKEEGWLRLKADAARSDAEKARDRTRRALAETEEALARARAEHDRAQKNLAVARKAVQHVLTTATTLDAHSNPALIPAYRNLLSGLEPFVEEILAQQTEDRGVRFDQFEIARMLGVLEELNGRTGAARMRNRIALGQIRGLARDYPRESRYQLELARTLAFGSSLIAADEARQDLAESREILERYLADRPRDAEGLHEMIRVRLAREAAPGSLEYTGEGDRAVLDLVDRLTEIQGARPHLAMTRAHAINNLASDLTNRGKTDEAETLWLEVLRIREALYRAQPRDRITSYEMGKCLSNYAIQLVRTGRAEEAFRTRERAAGIFDTLHGDARNRTTYISVMIDIDRHLAWAYEQRRQPEKAAERWTKLIDLASILLDREPQSAGARGLRAQAHARRAEFADAAGRHAEAARDFRTAAEFSTAASHRDACRSRHVLALARGGLYAAAFHAAQKLTPARISHPLPCFDLARAWLLIARADGEPLPFTPFAAAIAIANARSCVLAARNLGWFRTEENVRAFRAQGEFEPLWQIIP